MLAAGNGRIAQSDVDVFDSPEKPGRLPAAEVGEKDVRMLGDQAVLSQS